MESVVFQTSGILDLRAITIFGCSAKPRTNSPIGYFGTGLKYALAILAREGCDVTIYRGTDAPLKLTTKQSSFRDTALSTIYLGEQELPFTTSLGQNWKLWQALREIESNTRDEGGSSYTSDEEQEPESGYTKIVITCEDFLSEYENLGDIFLDTDKDNISELESIEIYKQSSDYLYYKGIRIYELPKSSAYTFNITRRMDLTEDRTLQYWCIAEKTIAHAIGSLQDYGVLHTLLTDPSDFISSVDFEYCTDSSVISKAFNETIRELHKEEALTNPSALRFVKSTDEPEEPEIDQDQILTDLVDELAVVILSTAYEPSERGAGYSCDSESLDEIKDLITTYVENL